MMSAFPLPPGSTIGLLGGGQLARMLALAAARLGFKTHIFCPEHEACASFVSHRTTRGAYDDRNALLAFAKSVDVVSYEFENIPVSVFEILGEIIPVFPHFEALARTQDRFVEKSYARTLGVETADFWEVSTEEEWGRVRECARSGGILKTRRLGYDGKGQVRVDGEGGRTAFSDLGGVPCIFEAIVPFTYEISVISARGMGGDFMAYDPSVNVHEGGILRKSEVLGSLNPALVEKAQGINQRFMEDLGYVGVMAIEYFVVEGEGEPRLFLNEMAPRVHNSGHWTEVLCVTSQFEQHIRAICGWPLGDVHRHSSGVMENILGEEVLDWLALAQKNATTVHIYDKGDPREGRKMAHCVSFVPQEDGEG